MKAPSPCFVSDCPAAYSIQWCTFGPHCSDRKEPFDFLEKSPAPTLTTSGRPATFCSPFPGQRDPLLIYPGRFLPPSGPGQFKEFRWEDGGCQRVSIIPRPWNLESFTLGSTKYSNISEVISQFLHSFY